MRVRTLLLASTSAQTIDSLCDNLFDGKGELARRLEFLVVLAYHDARFKQQFQTRVYHRQR